MASFFINRSDFKTFSDGRSIFDDILEEFGLDDHVYPDRTSDVKIVVERAVLLDCPPVTLIRNPEPKGARHEGKD